MRLITQAPPHTGLELHLMRDSSRLRFGIGLDLTVDLPGFVKVWPNAHRLIGECQLLVGGEPVTNVHGSRVIGHTAMRLLAKGKGVRPMGSHQGLLTLEAVPVQSLRATEHFTWSWADLDEGMARLGARMLGQASGLQSAWGF